MSSADARVRELEAENKRLRKILRDWLEAPGHEYQRDARRRAREVLAGSPGGDERDTEGLDDPPRTVTRELGRAGSALFCASRHLERAGETAAADDAVRDGRRAYDVARDAGLWRPSPASVGDDTGRDGEESHAVIVDRRLEAIGEAIWGRYRGSHRHPGLLNKYTDLQRRVKALEEAK